MKNVARSLFTALLIVCVCTSCFHHKGRISLTVSESGQYYKIHAEYATENTRHIEQYLDKKLGSGSNISFINTHIDALLTLNDGTKLYMKNEPGELDIRFDKTENNDAAYERMKSLSEGLKSALHEQ